MADAHEEFAEKQDKISLYLSNKEVFVWDKNAVMKLRKEYRIVGSLVGSLPSKPRQNLVFSLPLVLLPEEARLLVDKSIARIVVSDIRESEETIEKFRNERKASMQQQIERLKELKQQKLESFAEIIEEGREKTNRKRKRCSKNTPNRKLARTENEPSCAEPILDQVNKDDSSPMQVAKDDGLTLRDNYTSTDDIPRSAQQIIASTEENQTSLKDICTSSDDGASLEDATLVCINTQALKGISRTKDIDWKFPGTEIERARCTVFTDLWEKGYFISDGNKFGGDYLVYPGDPMRYHSHFIVKIVPLEQKLSGLDLITFGRLGSTVKKTSVLASVNSMGEVLYTSVQWSGFP